MKFQLKAVLVLILLLVSAVPLLYTVTQDAQAAMTLYVGPTSTYQKIQDAINDSSDYSLIYIENGIYHENLDFNILPGFNSLTFIGNGSVTINGTTGLCFALNGTKLQQLHLYNLSLASSGDQIYASAGSEVYLYGTSYSKLSIGNTSICHVYKWIQLEVYYYNSAYPVIGADIKWAENGVTRYATQHYFNGSFSVKTNLNGTLPGPLSMKCWDYVYSSTPQFANNEIWIYKARDDWVETFKTVSANFSHTEVIHLSKDIVAPPQPTGLKVNADSQTELNVSWDPVLTPDLSHYNVYTNLTGPWVAKANTTLNWYLDGGYSPGQTVYYMVTAVDQAGLESDISANASSTTLVPTFGSVECALTFQDSVSYPTLNYSTTVSLVDATGGVKYFKDLYGSTANHTFSGIPLETPFTIHADPDPEVLGSAGTSSGWLPFVSDNFTLTLGYISISQNIILERYDLNIPTAYVEGVVNYSQGPEDGNAADGAEVRLLNSTGAVLSTLWTDIFGHFYFENVPKNQTYSMDILPLPLMAWKNGTDGYLITHVKKFMLSGDLSINCSLAFSGSAKEPLMLLDRKPMGLDVPMDSVITLQFNHPMDLTPLIARFELAPLVGNLAFDQTNDTTIAISHDPFKPETTYTITIGEGLRARNNAGFALGYMDRTWTFTTGTLSVQKTISISQPSAGKQFGPGETISVSGGSKGLAPDTVITVELDGVQQTCMVKNDGSWAVNIQTPSKEGSYKITVSGGTVNEDVTIRVVDGGGSSDSGFSIGAYLGLIVVIFIIVVVVLLVRRSRRRAAMSNAPPPTPAQTAPAKAKAAPSLTQAAPPKAKGAPSAKPTGAAPKAATAPPKTAAQPARAKPAATTPSKPAKGQPAPAAPKARAPAPPPGPEEMPEMPMVPPEIAMESVFEEMPEEFEPGAPIEEELTKEKVEEVREEDLGGERKPLTPDQQRMYKRAQGMERALNFERAALMYEDLEMWDDARRCRQAKMKEDASKDLDLNVYRGRAPTSKSKSAQDDFDEFGQIKDSKGAMFSCPGCGSMILSQPCRRCGWHGGEEHMEKMMREKKM